MTQLAPFEYFVKKFAKESPRNVHMQMPNSKLQKKFNINYRRERLPT
jgi:hypothetical protein